jgi:small subunit ribosomal protein S6
MAIYESIVILDSLLTPKDIDNVVDRLSVIIQERGGVIRKIDKWGKKRLAYEIEKKQYGFYISIEFEGDGNIPHVLESDYNYSDNVLRYLTYRFDKYKIRAMQNAAEQAKAPAAAVPAAEAVVALKPETNAVTQESQE